jgi:hypothetical protein
VTRLWAGQLGFNSQQGQGFFSLCHCVQTSCRACQASYGVGTGGGFPDWDMKLTTHLDLVMRLRMCGAIPPLHGSL